MPSILTIIRGIYHNQFKYIYLKMQTLSLVILLHFRNVHEILNTLAKNIEPHSFGIYEIIHSEKRGY